MFQKFMTLIHYIAAFQPFHRIVNEAIRASRFRVDSPVFFPHFPFSWLQHRNLTTLQKMLVWYFSVLLPAFSCSFHVITLTWCSIYTKHAVFFFTRNSFSTFSLLLFVTKYVPLKGFPFFFIFFMLMVVFLSCFLVKICDMSVITNNILILIKYFI